MEAFDIVIVADMGRAGDIGLRIDQDIRSHSTSGYRVGLVHAGARDSTVRIHPEILRDVREGRVEVIQPSSNVRAKLLIGYLPFVRLPGLLATLSVDRSLLVVDALRDSNLNEIHETFSTLFGIVSWAPTNPWLRAYLACRYPALPMEEFDWIPGGPPTQSSVRQTDSILRVGVISDHAQEIVLHSPSTGEPLDIICIDCSDEQHKSEQGAPRIPTLRLGEIAIERLMREVAVVVYCPPPEQMNHPDATIASAHASGKLVVLARHLKPHYRSGPIYCDPTQLSATVEQLSRKKKRKRRGPNRSSPARAYGEKIHSLLGHPSRRPADPIPRLSREHVYAAFFVTTESGDEALTQLLAIARRAEDICRPIFVTTQDNIEAVEAFGYAAEHIPPRHYSLASSTDWLGWFRVEFEGLADAHDPRLVVVGDRAPCQAVLDSMAPRGDCRLAWATADFPKERTESFSCSSFDLVLDIGDLNRSATPLEHPSTNQRLVHVDPITLFDDEELLTRETAALALGFDHTKPTILLRLGTEAIGASRVVRAIEQLNGLEGVQIAVLDESDKLTDLLWRPHVTGIKGFPIAQYLNAFDLSIASPDYCAFHDSIAHCLPTIFLNGGSDETEGRDRVRCAEAAGAAIGLSEVSLGSLPSMIQTFLANAANDFMRSNCRRFRRGNGAGDAAKALHRLFA